MATFTSDQIDGNQVFKPFPDGNLGVRYAKYSVAAAPNATVPVPVIGVNDESRLEEIRILETELRQMRGSIENNIGRNICLYKFNICTFQVILIII